MPGFLYEIMDGCIKSRIRACALSRSLT